MRRWLRRVSIAASVAASWLGAYVLWTFAGGLAVHYGLLATYQGAIFLPVVVIGGLCHYRAQLSAGHPTGLTLFVGVQLAWLAFVLLQNGVFGEVRW